MHVRVICILCEAAEAVRGVGKGGSQVAKKHGRNTKFASYKDTVGCSVVQWL